MIERTVLEHCSIPHEKMVCSIPTFGLSNQRVELVVWEMDE
jgi:hypothetical protein